MFGTNFFQENPEEFDTNLFQGQIPNFFNAFDALPAELMPKEFFPGMVFADASHQDPTQFFQLMDHALQNMPDEIKQWFPFMDFMMPTLSDPSEPSEPNLCKSSPILSPNLKIGSITLEERRLKVQKFLEKRKRRNFKKKISYMCRKKVADKRVRVKGRFVSKIQAEAIKIEKDEIENA